MVKNSICIIFNHQYNIVHGIETIPCTRVYIVYYSINRL